MTHTPRSKRHERIATLDVRPQVRQLLASELELGAFADYFREPDYFYAQGYPDKEGDWPMLDKFILLPLWEHGENVFALDLKQTQGEVISFYLECPESYDSYKNIDLALFAMIELHVWEYGGEEEEVHEALEFAELVCMPHMDRLRTMLLNYTTCTQSDLREYTDAL